MAETSSITLTKKEIQEISGGDFGKSVSDSLKKAVDKLGLIYCTAREIRQGIESLNSVSVVKAGGCLFLTGLASDLTGQAVGYGSEYIVNVVLNFYNSSVKSEQSSVNGNKDL